MFQHLLYKSSGSILARNKKFINRHKGESCRIFAAGHSIRSMDLKSLPAMPSIGLNFFCVHKDYPELDILYHAIPQPFFFYPLFRTTKNKYIRNIMAGMFRNILAQSPHINVFTSLSNLFGYNNKQSYFMHHFGQRIPDRNFCDITKVNSFMHAGLNAAIGLAINLGFEKAYLVGCDYLFGTKKSLHFYSHGQAAINPNRDCVYPDLLRESKELIDLELITVTDDSPWLASRTYQEFSGNQPGNYDNLDIVPKQHLDGLHAAYLAQQLPNPVYAPV